jgi:hypothetical protein
MLLPEMLLYRLLLLLYKMLLQIPSIPLLCMNRGILLLLLPSAVAVAANVAAVPAAAAEVGAIAAVTALTNAADLHASACQGTQGGLGTRTRGLGLVAAGGAQLDVQGVDSQLL